MRTAPLRFLLASSFVAAVCALLVRTQMFAAHPDIAAWGITFDLTITIPLLYWFFVVRAKKAPVMTLAPVFVVCTLAASALVPRAHQQFLRDLGRFAVPLAELALLGAIVHRLRTRRGENPIRALLGDTRIADVVESELSIVYYAFAGWRQQPAPVEGRAITFHERAGWGTILAGLLLLIAAEGIGMHLLLAQWTPAAAWTWTFLDVWGAIWLLGDYQALRLRRSFLTEDALHIRFGLRWTVTVPLASIVSIEDAHDWRRKDVLKVAILEDPRYVITLREPLVARGLAGLRKEIRAIALLPDDDEAISALRSALWPGGESAARR